MSSRVLRNHKKTDDNMVSSPAKTVTTPKRKRNHDEPEEVPQTPSLIGGRISAPNTPSTPADRTRHILHASTFSESARTKSTIGPLLCREKEFHTIYNFIDQKIKSQLSGYMYISGTPGSGKTATVHRVLKKLGIDYKGKKNAFKFVEVNGMCLTEPTKAYVKVWEKIGDGKGSAKQALNKLCDRFSARPSNSQSVILFVDELDCIYNRTPKVIFNILQWQMKSVAQLIVLTIANTDDLITTLKNNFKGKLTIQNLHFDIYSNENLKKIVLNRLKGSVFHPDAVQYLINKSFFKNGDIRAILHTCRKVIDIIEKSDNSISVITQDLVMEACEEFSVDPSILAIKHCSIIEKLVLRAIRDESTAQEFREFSLEKLYFQFQAICTLEGEPCPTVHELYRVCYNLSLMGLLTLLSTPINIRTMMVLNIDYKLITVGLLQDK